MTFSPEHVDSVFKAFEDNQVFTDHICALYKSEPGALLKYKA
jgi:hypothetical protein